MRASGLHCEADDTADTSPRAGQVESNRAFTKDNLLQRRTNKSPAARACQAKLEGVRYEEVAVADLLLDGQNPRHETTTGQREAIAALFAEDGPKMVGLARDIVAYGTSPIDVLLVLKSGSRMTVLEGNRRLAVLKTLANPDLAPTEAMKKRFREFADESAPPEKVECTFVTTREEGRHWMELRHGGEMGGAGVVPWNAEATSRFRGRRASQADKALVVVDALEKAFPKNAQLQADLEKVRRERLTTFGRLMSDPSVRERIGIDVEDHGVTTHFPARQVEHALGRVLGDLASDLSVTELKTKEQRKKYMGAIQGDLPNGADYKSDSKALPQRPTPTPAKKSKPKPTPAGATPKPLFDGVVVVNLGGKVSGVLSELKQLNVDRFPHAAAALIRVLMELAVYQVYETKKWKAPDNLKAGVKYCLTKIDPGNTAAKFQAVRVGISDGNSLLSVRTMQAFLHNAHFSPTGSDLRTIASNYAPFLIALDGLV
jgi:hypothetical protein